MVERAVRHRDRSCVADAGRSEPGAASAFAAADARPLRALTDAGARRDVDELLGGAGVEDVGRARASLSARCRRRTPHVPIPAMLCASAPIETMTPASRTRCSTRQSRSSRWGSALISSATPVAGSLLDHRVEIQPVRVAGEQQTTGRMADDGEVRVVHRGEQARGHLRGGHVEAAVNRGDHEVEPLRARRPRNRSGRPAGCPPRRP